MSNDRVVVITGASSGIGKCCAEYLVQKKFRIYGTSRKPISTADEITSSSTNLIQMIQMDVDDKSSVNQGIDRIMARESRIDVVINNAGFAIMGSMEDTTITEAKSQFETNFFGALRVCRAVLPIMRNQQSGYIVNISSIGGLIGLPFQSAYCASKFALEGAMETLRLEVRPFGIHVILVEPGDYKTELTEHRLKTEQSMSNSGYLDRFKKAMRKVELGEQNGPNPESIAILVNKIISMNSPRLRYTVGRFSQRIAVPLKKVLPSCLFESIIARTFGTD
ncbi:MAG: SDR family oxidoreductase [Desulfobacterales bacterium]|nr:SDR family oxidoreductase [Desulfobacterales bacterium]